MQTVPCRLSVYLATAAPVGIVLRRGPAAWSRLSVWHTDTDTFEHGQWFKGRMYEHRSDISPDGSLFLYFARKDGPRTPDMTQVDSWLAISRPPWFTALALWPVGSTWDLGGFFTTPTSVYVGRPDPPELGELPFWLTSDASLPEIDRSLNWTDRGVYYRRLLRDGWTQSDESVAGSSWRRSDPDGRLTLTMTKQYGADEPATGGAKGLEFTLLPRNGEAIDLGPAGWADWDRRGRLVMAREGRLLHWQPGSEPRELEDFNPQRPESAPAPDWATTWPRRPGHPR